MKKSRQGAISSQDSSLPVLPGWSFLTNHTHVMLCIYRDPTVRLRDIALLVGITERMVQKIVAELIGGGYLGARKEGRRNHYVVDPGQRLRHPLESHHSVGELLQLLAGDGAQGRS